MRRVQRPGWEDAPTYRSKEALNGMTVQLAECIVDTVQQNRKQSSETGGGASLLDRW